MKSLIFVAGIAAAICACGGITIGGGGTTPSGTPANGDTTIWQSGSPSSAASFSLASTSGCSKDANDNLVINMNSDPQNKQAGIQVPTQLIIMIKGVLSKPAEYTCAQKEKNKSGDASPYDFDSCMISLLLRSQYNAQTHDHYNMIRTEKSVGPFEYTNSCSIKIKKLDPISGTYECENLPLTHVNNQPLSTVATQNGQYIKGKFSCTAGK